MIKLSPVIRLILGAAVAAGVAALTGLQDNNLSIEDIIAIVVAGGGAFGLVPGQVGGTQHGVINPSVVDVPPSDNIEAR